MMEDTTAFDKEEQSDNLYPTLQEESLSVDPKQLEKEENEAELAKLEEEISTLKQVLAVKETQASALRKTLGLGPLSQIKNEINKVQTTPAYLKTQETLKSAGQATANVFASMTSKFSEMKNSNTFKSFEEKMDSVGSSFMGKFKQLRLRRSSNVSAGDSENDDEAKVQGLSGAKQDQVEVSGDAKGAGEPVIEQPKQESTDLLSM